MKCIENSILSCGGHLKAFSPLFQCALWKKDEGKEERVGYGNTKKRNKKYFKNEKIFIFILFWGERLRMPLVSRFMTIVCSRLPWQAWECPDGGRPARKSAAKQEEVYRTNGGGRRGGWRKGEGTQNFKLLYSASIWIHTRDICCRLICSLHVCMYACMYVCMFATAKLACEYECICMCVHVCMFVHVCIMHEHKRLFFVYVCMRACV